VQGDRDNEEIDRHVQVTTTHVAALARRLEGLAAIDLDTGSHERVERRTDALGREKQIQVEVLGAARRPQNPYATAPPTAYGIPIASRRLASSPANSAGVSIVMTGRGAGVPSAPAT